nr:UDP-glucuronic acid decarboxylase family protein [Pelagibacterium lacus]
MVRTKRQVRQIGAGRTACVAGGAGFLGSHLCERLLADGYDVFCLDNLHTGRIENISAFWQTGHFQFLEHDIIDCLPPGLPRFDEVYNMACPASPVHYQADRMRTALTCAWGTMNLLDRAKADRAKYLQASTSEVYGDPEVHPQRETYVGHVNPIGPRSCYDEGKRFAETLCMDSGVRVRIARIFNTYGPRMLENDGRVVSNFIVQALRGEDITIYGDGRQTRSFCYVDDLIDGLIALMRSEQQVEGPVNIGNPSEIEVGELASIVVAMASSRSRVVHMPRPIDDPMRRRPDISKAYSLLGWAPQVDLLHGLERTIAYFASVVGHSRLVPA